MAIQGIGATGAPRRRQALPGGAVDGPTIRHGTKWLMWPSAIGCCAMLSCGQQLDPPMSTTREPGSTCALISNALWTTGCSCCTATPSTFTCWNAPLYNGFLGGVSFSGDTVFYTNSLASDGQRRSMSAPARFATPGRMLLQAHQRGAPAAVAGEATVPMAGRYRCAADRLPLIGAVKLAVDPPGTSAFTLRVRNNGWARSEPVPSELYCSRDAAGEAPSLLVNGAPSTLVPGAGAAPSSGAAGGLGTR